MYCPGETVSFTCSVSDNIMRWDITPLQGAAFDITLSTSNNDETQGMLPHRFRAVLTDTSGRMLIATLTSLTVASTVEGTMVTCGGVSSQEGPLTITVASEYRG